MNVVFLNSMIGGMISAQPYSLLFDSQYLLDTFQIYDLFQLKSISLYGLSAFYFAGLFQSFTSVFFSKIFLLLWFLGNFLISFLTSQTDLNNYFDAYVSINIILVNFCGGVFYWKMNNDNRSNKFLGEWSYFKIDSDDSITKGVLSNKFITLIFRAMFILIYQLYNTYTPFYFDLYNLITLYGSISIFLFIVFVPDVVEKRKEKTSDDENMSKSINLLDSENIMWGYIPLVFALLNSVWYIPLMHSNVVYNQPFLYVVSSLLALILYYVSYLIEGPEYWYAACFMLYTVSIISVCNSDMGNLWTNHIVSFIYFFFSGSCELYFISAPPFQKQNDKMVIYLSSPIILLALALDPSILASYVIIHIICVLLLIYSILYLLLFIEEK